MPSQVHSNFARADSLANLANGSQTPDLKAIGIQLLECLLIPAVTTIVLAVMLSGLYRAWKNRQAAKKEVRLSRQVEEGLPTLQERTETLQIRQPASPHFKHPEVAGCSTASVPSDSSTIDFAYMAPPTPSCWLRGLQGVEGIQGISLGKSVSAPPSVSVFSAVCPPTPPPTPCLHGVEGSDDIEELDLGESAMMK